MSIIIQIGGTPLASADAVAPAPACIVETTTDMGPGLEHENEISLMPEESVTVSVYSPVKSSGSQARVSKANHSSCIGYANCFGLPYQDHNYGAPPPPTPPQSPPPPPKVNGVIDDDTSLSVISTPSTNNEEEPQEESITRCICGFDHDDEYMICCDKCFVWQHVDCMGLDRNSIPEMYMCEKCSPRKVDRQKAKALQARKKGKLRDATTDESKEDEEVVGKKVKNHKNKKSELKNDQVNSRKVKTVKQSTREKTDAKKKVQRRVRRNRRESTNNADEEAQDAWESSLREWIDKYENALINQYTPEVQLLTGSLKLNGQHDELVKKVSEQLHGKLCKVGVSCDSRKLLLAAQDIKGDQAIVEYRGKFLSVSQFREKNPVFNRRLYPFVLFYKPQNDEDDVCVDAREYGNEARFVRRSCAPNAVVRHVIQNGLIHLYLFSCKDIKKDQEITIPFDFNFQECGNEADCACGKMTCPLQTQSVKNEHVEPSPEKKRRRTKSGCNQQDDESSLSTPAKPVVVKSEACQNQENSNPNITTSLETNQAELKPTPEEQETEEQAAERRKKMTREERKIDAIMRAFERMEKTAKRRQQALERMAQHRAQNQKPASECDSDKPEEMHDENSNNGALLATETKTEDVSPVEPLSGEEKTSNAPTTTSPQLAVLPQVSRHRKGRRRRGSCSISRKRIRTNSGSSDIMSPDEGLITTVQQVQCPPSSLPNTVPCSLPPAEAEPLPPAASVTPACASSNTKLPKTKRILMHEWLQEKAEAAITTTSTASTSTAVATSAPSPSPLPVQTEIPIDSAVPNANCFVRCTRDNPSGGISAAHLRRNTISQPHGGKNTSLGSAKKRWLRQAMCETETPDVEGSFTEILENDQSSPLHAECSSPSPHTCGNAPCISPSGGSAESMYDVLQECMLKDIVTPLKKRRLVRESTESALSPGAVSPCPSTGDLTGSVHSAGSPAPSVPLEISPSELPGARVLTIDDDAAIVSSSVTSLDANGTEDHTSNKIHEKPFPPKDAESDTCNTLDSLPDEPSASESYQDAYVTSAPEPSSCIPGDELGEVSRDSLTEQPSDEITPYVECTLQCDNSKIKSDKEPDSSTNECASSSLEVTSKQEATKFEECHSPEQSNESKVVGETTEDLVQVCDSLSQETPTPCHSSTHPFQSSSVSAAVSTVEPKQPAVNCSDASVDSTVQLHIKSQDDFSVRTDNGASPSRSFCAESSTATVCDNAVTSTPSALCSVSSTTPIFSNGSVGTGQKRKVSLTEYRMRMKDSANGRSSDSSKAGSKNPITSCSNDSNECTPKLSLLPIFDSSPTSSTPKASLSSKAENKDSGKEASTSDEEGKRSSSASHLESIPEQRESLSQRLRREFGVIDDDSDSEDAKSKVQALPSSVLQPPQNIPVAVAFNVGQPPPPPIPVVTGNTQLKATPHFAYSTLQPYPTQAFIATQMAPPHFLPQPAQGQHVPVLTSAQLPNMPAVAGSRAVPVPGRPQAFSATSAPPPPPGPPPGSLTSHHHHHTTAHTSYAVVGNIAPNFVSHHASPAQQGFQNHFGPAYFK